MEQIYENVNTECAKLEFGIKALTSSLPAAHSDDDKVLKGKLPGRAGQVALYWDIELKCELQYTHY